MDNLISNIKDFIKSLHISYLVGRPSKEVSLSKLGEQIVIIAPHPDDEVIGCGGLIIRLVTDGRLPHVIVMTGGEESHRSCCELSVKDLKQARRKLTDDALRMLSIDRNHIHVFDFPDGGISADDPEMTKLKELIDEINPDTVFVPHWGEGWPDHVMAAKIVKEIAPKQAAIYEYCVWMWYYNVWRGLDWKNAYKLKMTLREHQLKLEAMDAYTKPLAPCGKPWSGVLPKIFMQANSRDTELYFRAR